MTRILLTLAGAAFVSFPTAAIAGQPPASPPADKCGPGPVYKAGQPGVSNPKTVTRIEPKFPDAPNRRVEGSFFVVEAIIDRTGVVCEARIVKSPRFTPPFPEYGEALLQAIRRWTYKPATRDGKPVKVKFTVTSSILLR